jgi:hypothetical protein
MSHTRCQQLGRGRPHDSDPWQGQDFCQGGRLPVGRRESENLNVSQSEVAQCPFPERSFVIFPFFTPPMSPLPRLVNDRGFGIGLIYASSL